MEININTQWAAALRPELSSDYFAQLWDFVEREYASGTCYPPPDRIFAALNACPLPEVKAVILGQDPYHEEGQAEGLSFSYAEGLNPGPAQTDLFGAPLTTAKSCDPRRWPPSLRNILREVSDDTGAPLPPNGSLHRWAEQGVLLLNATLTVRQGQANSHASHGWERFTDAITRLVSQQCQHVVFFLWGSYAQKKIALIDTDRHLVLQSPHPSPLSAHRGFFGNHQFTRANEYLAAHGRQPIVW